MLTTNLLSRYFGIAFFAGLAMVACGDDDDTTSGTAGGGATSRAGTASTGGYSGSTSKGGAQNQAGEPGTAAGGAPSAGASAVGAVVRTDLTSDQAKAADNLDVNLVNAWGISFDPAPKGDAAFWVSAADGGVSTVYSADGTPASLVVTIPAADAAGTGSPTGQVYNSTTGFSGDKFIFASEDGLITGWKAGTKAVMRADRSADAAEYKGLTLIGGDAPMLLAANFHAGTVDVFDAKYAVVDAAASFVDADLPAGFAPFNVAALGDKVYVAYAKQDADMADEVAGPGNGYVSVFEPDGTFDARLVSKGALNAPWGLALAPDDFTPAPGALIVGNFGDGMIHAYDLNSGKMLSEFMDINGDALVIDGLWGLAFGPKKGAEDLSTHLFFTAGPEEEAHGLFGVLTAP